MFIKVGACTHVNVNTGVIPKLLPVLLTEPVPGIFLGQIWGR